MKSYFDGKLRMNMLQTRIHEKMLLQKSLKVLITQVTCCLIMSPMAIKVFTCSLRPTSFRVNNEFGREGERKIWEYTIWTVKP